ncbi:MAG: hypothetical protein AB4290_00635 [Spirulina sp.]
MSISSSLDNDLNIKIAAVPRKYLSAYTTIKYYLYHESEAANPKKLSQ